MLTLVDPETMTDQDSQLLPDSAKAAIRSYLGRFEDSVWMDVAGPEMDRLVGRCRGLTAMLDTAALPEPGHTATVLIEVPGAGPTEFRLAHVRNDSLSAPTYTGQARGGEMSILLVRDSVVVGRINTDAGTYNFRSGPFGLIHVDDADGSGSLPELHLIQTTTASAEPNRFTPGARC